LLADRRTVSRRHHGLERACEPHDEAATRYGGET
jgi:hypothetical protein